MPLLRAPYRGGSISSSAARRREGAAPPLLPACCAFPRAPRRSSPVPTNPQASLLASSSPSPSPRQPPKATDPRTKRQQALAPAAADANAADAAHHPQYAADRRWMAVALEQARLAGERGEVPIGAVVVVAVEEEEGAEATTPTTTTTAATTTLTLLGAPRGNEAEARCDPTAHAEMLALKSALSQLSSQGKSWRAVLPRATLYVTCEPCPMCAGAALACRVGRVVYGARQPRVGADGSWASVLRGGGDGGVTSSLWSASDEVEEEGEEVAAAAATGRAASAPSSSPSPSPSSPAAAAPAPLPPHPYHPNLEVRSGVRADEAAELLRDFFRRRRRERRHED